MQILKNGTLYQPRPEYIGRSLMIAIDSSKTNTAITVDDEYGNKLDDYELRGAVEDDILQLCWWERKCLSVIFSQARIVVGGIEDIITKKDKNGQFSHGIEIHKSRFMITAVFMSLITYFQDNHDFTLALINNWSWKAAVLPEEYRKDGHHKGSLDWHRDRGTVLASRTDDITDSDCIMQYLKMTHNISSTEVIKSEPELSKYKYKAVILALSNDFAGLVEYKDNEDVTLENKCAYISNRLKEGEMAYVKIRTSTLTIQQIYTLCKGRFEQEELQLALCVRRL